MRRLRWLFLPLVVPLCLACGLAAQDSPQPGSDQNASVPATVTQLPAASASVPPTSFDQVVERIVEREHFFVAQMRHLHPLVETYIQNMKADKDMGAVPVGDHYFLGRLDMSQGTEDRSFTTRPGLARRMLTNLTSLYSLHFLPLGFAQMVMLDDDFQRKYYNLNFVRREFIGWKSRRRRGCMLRGHMVRPMVHKVFGIRLVLLLVIPSSYSSRGSTSINFAECRYSPRGG